MSIKRIVLSVVFIAFISLNIAAQSNWIDYGNPIFDPTMGAYYPSVLYNADGFCGMGEVYQYKMWFANGDGSSLGLAASNDGLNWTILAIPLPGLKAGGYHCQVLFDPDWFGGSGCVYRMWYWDPAGLYSIGAIRTATSLDGVNWSNDQAITQVGTTVITGSSSTWNYGSYGPIALIYNASGSGTLDDSDVFNNMYVMYYIGATGSTEQWGLAYSADGLLWKGYNGGASPVLPAGFSGDWDEHYASAGSVIRGAGSNFEAWYSGGKAASSEGVGHAVSADGINWTKDSLPLTILGCPATGSSLGCAGSWNDTRNYTPVVLGMPFASECSWQSYKMWRTGRTSASGNLKSIGFASIPSVLFDSTYASPDTAGSDSGQAVLITLASGSTAPSSFTFTWPAEYTVRGFDIDPDGILGLWQEMKPYVSPFSPTSSYQIIRLGNTSAYADVNGNHAYDAGTDHDLSLSGRAYAVTRAVAPDSLETDNAGYRLILQEGLFTNPSAAGNYTIGAHLDSSCWNPWNGSSTETISSPGGSCSVNDMTDIGDSVRIARADNDFTISWDSAAEPWPGCMTGYAVFASTDCTTWSAYSRITGQDLDLDSTNSQFTAGNSCGLTYYLVTQAGSAGEMGPVGSYGM